MRTLYDAPIVDIYPSDVTAPIGERRRRSEAGPLGAEERAVAYFQQRGVEAFHAEVMFWNMFVEVLVVGFLSVDFSPHPTPYVAPALRRNKPKVYAGFIEWIASATDPMALYMEAFRCWARARLRTYRVWTEPLAPDILAGGLAVGNGLSAPVIARITDFICAEGWARGFPDLVLAGPAAALPSGTPFALAEVKSERDRVRDTQVRIFEFLHWELEVPYLLVRVRR